ncbi:MAG: TetR/AcrR family transcriptional regulator [Coriobacteriia bacterium]|nr:TetR/AcrR family transcriptional regulator [Coriobacteriia bacterium]
MGRPRIDTNEPSAVDRIYEAYWKLLEDNMVKDITISMVSATAGCNRGTFYYHFKDMDDLLYRVIEKDLMGSEDESYAHLIFRMLATPSSELLLAQVENKMTRHLYLLASQGGMEIVSSKIKEIIRNMWKDILCEEGHELSFESLLMIEYSVSGLISIILMVCRMKDQGCEIPESIDVDALQQVARIQIVRLARFEDVDPSEILMRLQMYDKFLKSGA